VTCGGVRLEVLAADARRVLEVALTLPARARRLP
jgi:hypothetical protein